MGVTRCGALLLTGLTMLLGACAGGPSGAPTHLQNADPPAIVEDSDAAAQFALPSPQSLPRTVSEFSPKWRAGSSNLEAPFEQNVVTLADQLQFTPQFAAGADSISGLAYSIYVFNDIEEDPGLEQIYLGWSGDPPAAQNVWLAVGDFPSNRWKFYQWPGEGLFLQTPLAPQMDSPEGLLHVAVVMTGDTPATLEYIYYVSEYGALDLSAVPDFGTDSLSVTLSVQLDMLGGVVSSYDFDVDGDGTYEVLQDEDGTIEVLYDSPGLYEPLVAAHTSGGQTLYGSNIVHVINSGNVVPSAQLQPAISSGDAPLLVEFDASGSSDSDGEIVSYEWDFDGDGIYDQITTEPTVALNYGKTGSFNAALRITDNDTGTATASVSVTVSNGWTVTELDPDAGQGNVDAATSGALFTYKPFVVYLNAQQAELRCVRSLDETGGSWSTIQVVDDRSGTGRNPSANSIDGDPAVVYEHDTPQSSDLYYQQAVDAATWGEPKLVATNAASQQRLASAEGKPLVLGKTSPDEELYAYLPAAEDLSSWSATLIDSGDPSGGPYLALGGVAYGSGIPFAIYSGSEPNELLISAADDAAASGWSAPFVIDTVQSVRPVVQTIASRPCVSYIDHETGSALYFVRSPDGNPTEWSAPVLVDDSGQKESSVGLASTPIGPAIAYVDKTRGMIMYVEPVDAIGSAWQSPVMIDSAPGVNIGLDIIGTSAGSVVFYRTKPGDSYKLFVATP